MSSKKPETKTHYRNCDQRSVYDQALAENRADTSVKAVKGQQTQGPLGADGEACRRVS
jgi:hypothetical protein